MGAEIEVVSPSGFEVEIGLISECGPRPENQDAAAAWRDERTVVALVVADGMGGHAAGREAAEIVVRLSFDGIRNRTQECWDKVLDQAVAQAHQGVLAAACSPQSSGESADRTGMGATAVLVVADLTATPTLHVAHVGDSRAYLFRGTSLFRLTRDHSLVSRMIVDGLLGESEAFGHPDNNVIERAIGQSQPLTAEVQAAMPLAADDLVLVATDGLHGVVPDDDICAILAAATSTQAACENLVACALAAGSQDNVTVGCLKLLDSHRPSQRRPTRVES
jgi:protein phosphatase